MTVIADHTECQRRAKAQRIAVPDVDHEYAAYVRTTENPEGPSEFHWRRVRETMPPYFWNAIKGGRCVWCNQPLEGA